MNFSKQFKEGLITQNPVLVQLLGMCSTLAITTSFFNGLGMGVSVTIILTLSNIFISLLRKIIPNEVRIACYIVVIAAFVSVVEMLVQAYFLDLYNALGVYLPLITVNSWNEWTEASYLQPDDLYGYGYLEAIKKVFVDENE